jgi:hypothetical protein
VVFNPPFVSYLVFRFFIRICETIEAVFPCSGILYLCFKSLGLDITSVIFKSFQNGSNIPFFAISFCQRIIQMLDSCVIHFPFDLIEKVLPISTNLPLELEIFSNGPFKFMYRKYTYEVVPIC